MSFTKTVEFEINALHTCLTGDVSFEIAMINGELVVEIGVVTVYRVYSSGEYHKRYMKDGQPCRRYQSPQQREDLFCLMDKLAEKRLDLADLLANGKSS